MLRISVYINITTYTITYTITLYTVIHTHISNTLTSTYFEKNSILDNNWYFVTARLDSTIESGHCT